MRLLSGLSALATVAALGVPANAAQSLSGTLSTSPAGVITAGVNASGILAGTSLVFDFFKPGAPGGSFISVGPGQFSGSLSTTTNALNSTTDFDFGTISFINAADESIHYDFQNGYFNGQFGEIASVWTSMNNPAGVIAGNYFLRITGTSRGDGSFGGQLTFNPLSPSSPVPEMATWMMMVAGFGAMGLAMRGSRRTQNAVTFG